MTKKFATEDQRYFERRKLLAERKGPCDLWSAVDYWPLYVGIGNLARYMARYEILKSTLDVPGHIAEFGSYKGANLLFLAKLMRILDPHSHKEIHCFDSFEGFTEIGPEDGPAEAFRNHYAGSYDELVDAIELYDLQDEVIIHRGLVEDTLGPLLAARQELSFSFVYCDLDLYSGTREILEQIHERLVRGGVFVMDEWNDGTYQGETVAVREFLKTHGDCYEIENVRHSRQPQLVLRRVTH